MTGNRAIGGLQPKLKIWLESLVSKFDPKKSKQPYSQSVYYPVIKSSSNIVFDVDGNPEIIIKELQDMVDRTDGDVKKLYQDVLTDFKLFLLEDAINV